MKTAFLVALLVTASASAQHVVFEEDFETGIPASWTHIHNSAHIDPWRRGFGLVDGSNDIYHEGFCTNGVTMRDNLLLSPVIDLSRVSRAFFECGQFQGSPQGRFHNAVVITTSGGQSTSVIYQETGTWSGFGTIKVDISAWAGVPNVQIGFHYRGAIANDWSVDNVRITTSPVQHSVANLVQGQSATFAVTAAVPQDNIAILLSLSGAGPVPTPWGNLNLTPSIIALPTIVADASGNASLTLSIPASTAGFVVYTQAVAFAPPRLDITNSLAFAIQ